MQNYAPGLPVVVSFALLDSAGAVLTPTALRSRIVDEAETALQGWANVALPGAPTDPVQITVLGALNILTPPALRGLRTVELEVTTAAGTVILSQSFLIQGSTGLAFGVNTFQTYTQAMLLATELSPNQIPAWTATTDRNLREAALSDAYERVLRMPIEILFDDTQAMLTVDTEFSNAFGNTHLRHLTPAQMQTLYKPMLAGLRKAQLVEADEILSDDPAKRARKDGVISMTTGESSQFFRNSRPLEMPICPRAMAYITRWIRIGAAIARS